MSELCEAIWVGNRESNAFEGVNILIHWCPWSRAFHDITWMWRNGNVLPIKWDRNIILTWYIVCRHFIAHTVWEVCLEVHSKKWIFKWIWIPSIFSMFTSGFVCLPSGWPTADSPWAYKNYVRVITKFAPVEPYTDQYQVKVIDLVSRSRYKVNNQDHSTLVLCSTSYNTVTLDTRSMTLTLYWLV